MGEPMQRMQGVSKGGLIEISGPDANGIDSRIYIKTFTCCHCGNIHHIRDDASEMGFCQQCHARECIGCAKRLNGTCSPFMKAIEAYEARMRLRASIGV